MENNTKEKPYKCLYCEVAFVSKSNQMRHMALHSKYKAHICPICEKGFSRKDDLNRHIKTHAKNIQMSVMNSPFSFYGSSNLSTTMSEDKPVLPDISQPMTSDKLMNDASTFIQISRSESIVEQDQTSEGLCNTIVKDGRYKCPFCDLAFPFLSSLKKHIVTHSKEKPHVCDVCEKGFKRKDDLAQHSKRHVRIELEMYCSEITDCSISSSEHTQSVNKKESTHISAHDAYLNKGAVVTETNNPMCHNVGERHYKCPFCSSMFSFFSALQEHIEIHSDEKPCVCFICSKIFETGYELTKHAKICKETNDSQSSQTRYTGSYSEQEQHHFSKGYVTENTQIQKCKLENVEDEERSSQSEDIISEANENRAVMNINHSENISCLSSPTEEQLIRYRSQFEKGLCEKNISSDGSEFFSEESVNKIDKTFNLDAIVKNTNDCPAFSIDNYIQDECYRCSICSAVFHTKTDLIRHVLLHSKEKLHKCPVCREGFKIIEDLVKHKEIHLKDTRRETSKRKKIYCKNRKKSDGISSKPDILDSRDLLSHDSKTIKNKVPVSSSSINTEETSRPYKCSVCNWAFHSKASLNRHSTVHSKEKPHECSVCKKRFKRKDDMMRHKSGHLKDSCENEGIVDKIVKPSVSAGEKEFASKSDGACHSRTVTKRDSSTDFSISSNHRNTKLKTLPGKNQGYRDGDVPMCSSEMKNDMNSMPEAVKNDVKEELDFAMNVAEHDKLEVDISLVKIENASEEKLGFNEEGKGNYDNATLHVCSICKKSYMRESDFTKHRKNVHNIFDKREGEQYICPVCGMSFRLKGNLRRHMSRHSNEKPFACKSCDKAFKRRDDRDKHEQIHLLDKVTCSVCGKIFTEKKRLELHMKLHENKKSFQCTVCKKIWRKQSELICHMRVHTNERPFKCTFCGKCFKSGSCLKLHSLRHKGEKTHKCSFCSHAFYSRGEMMRHVNTHTRNKSSICHMCGKEFSLPASLKRHISIHIGMKPHKCSLCPKRFNQSYQLRAHLKSHTGIKPHKCSVCNKAFSERRTLDNHMLCHVGEKSVKD